MDKRTIKEGIYWMGAVDWDRRLFDSLVPLPDGTTYNAYLIEGSEKTALLDAVDPAMAEVLFHQLRDTRRIDYIVSHHTEQDHSGTIPLLLERYPEAQVLATAKGTSLLVDHLHLPEDRVRAVADGETLSLGDKTLRFVHTPWVHWPETMCSYLEEERILFSCDFFGAHIAASDLFVTDRCRVYEAAKRYFGEIMLPFRAIIAKNLEKLGSLEVDLIAPSHGQVYDEPAWILEAYADWALHPPQNLVVLPFVTMHGSTALMVEHLTEGLVARGVRVERFNLTVTDIGKLAAGPGGRGHHRGRHAHRVRARGRIRWPPMPPSWPMPCDPRPCSCPSSVATAGAARQWRRSPAWSATSRPRCSSRCSARACPPKQCTRRWTGWPTPSPPNTGSRGCGERDRPAHRSQADLRPSRPGGRLPRARGPGLAAGRLPGGAGGELWLRGGPEHRTAALVQPRPGALGRPNIKAIGISHVHAEGMERRHF